MEELETYSVGLTFIYILSFPFSYLWQYFSLPGLVTANVATNWLGSAGFKLP